MLKLKAFSCRKSYCFDLVSIEVSNESAVIVGVIILANARRAFVSSAICEGNFVKPSDSFPVRGLKGDVNPITGSCGKAICWSFEAENDVGYTVVGRFA